ncbi:DNA replication and repair protein RecN [Roseibium hamelinense]|uniref:DNA repair protein RecN n=1 Tax=Roseibium hamelinense TaxID=150831 RepID=A0A562T9B9_9HYPH|nr:DNA repair protein RecN [Roseibium hamelinense]MTI45419.1 DNA repair protein RecN [Roseibium hamelinense]TWI90209.1 DNA replication and repair protein RecN [Roseibium hamelinense]
MLVTLSIRDIVLIDRLDLDFAPGMSVLTGETGAGKSILLDSLSLAIGGRGDADLVRHGETQGQVTAVFDVPGHHAVRSLLKENDVDDDGDIILRRVQTSDGRTRAFINDQPVSVGLMRQAGTLLVEIHGQHDDRALVDPDSHRMLVDSFAGLQGETEAVGKAYSDWRAAEKSVRDHESRIDKARQEADFLKSAVDELTTLAPQAGEEEALAERRTTMMQAEKIAGDLNEAFETLNGGASPIPELASLLRRMERKADQVPNLLNGPVTAIAAALDQLEEARGGLEAALRETDFDPRELETVEERLFALRAASRKFSVPVDELGALSARMADDLADLDAGEDKLTGLKEAALKARAAFDEKAQKLSQKRVKAARALEKAVAAELPALKLERAKFIVEIASDPENGGRTGIDQMEFHVQTNPGTKPGPMMKVASGGELSRFLLALKVSLADKGSAPTLVFDEIDTGVGGAVAEAIGLRLARLAAQVQVLTVTHAPQVAARAEGHFLIAKEQASKDRVATRVRRIDEGHRREEIARMLAGSVITEEARAAAGKLIAEAAS